MRATNTSASAASAATLTSVPAFSPSSGEMVSKRVVSAASGISPEARMAASRCAARAPSAAVA